MAENINRRLNIYINDREVVNSMRGVTGELTKTRNEIRNLNKGAADYDAQLKRLTDTQRKLQAEQAKFRADLNQTPGILGKIKNALGPVATGFIAAFSVTALVAGFANKMREAWRTVVDFDQKQADLAAIMQKSRVQIAGLTLDALKYGATTAYTASEVSILQTELARLGKTEKEIKSMTEGVLNAATALETDLGSAAELIGGQLNSYGENAAQAGRYSDVMAGSVNISATSFESLATSLPKVSKVAAISNVSFEELNATLGVLADESIAAETAGTGFRNILLESAKAGKPYQEMLEQVRTSADQSKKAMELFGKENATVAVILANSTEKVKAQTIALENSAGSAEKLAKEKLNSITGSSKLFASAWEGFLLNVEKGDGVIGRAVKRTIDFGTSLLGLITPLSKVSDGIADQQLGLNMLVSKLTSTNIKEDERKRLMIQLKDEYPDFIAFIGKEDASNSELLKGLNGVNEQYIKRIALQKQVEEVESKMADVGFSTQRRLEKEEQLYQRLNKVKGEKGLDIVIDNGDLKGSAERVLAELEKRGERVGFFSDRSAIKNDLESMKAFEYAIEAQNKKLQEQEGILARQQKSFGMKTEAQREAEAAEMDRLKGMVKLREEVMELGMKDAILASEQEMRIWLENYKEKKKYSGDLSDEEQKKREKAIADAKKHSEDMLRELERSESELLATRRAFEDINLGAQKEGFEKELALLNTEYDRRIEDTKIKVAQLQTEIDKLGGELKDPKNSSSDITALKAQIANKIEVQNVYSSMSTDIERTRVNKIGALQEKYLQQHFQKKQEAHARDLQLLQTRQNNELADITSLEDAKALLSNYLSEEELKKVRTLEQARKTIKREFQKEEVELQKKHLTEMMTVMQSMLTLNENTGLEIISPEQREAILKFLDDAALKFSALRAGSVEGKEAPKEGLKALSGIDILGFTPDQWTAAFDSLDTFGEKIGAIEMIVGAMGNAWGSFFNIFDNADQRSLQKFQRTQNTRKKELETQLDKGYITQELYAARMEKLETEMRKKQAEAEYKKAKREKITAALGIVVNTALGVTKAYAISPQTFGLPWSAVIAGMGALNLATVLSQPLPPKEGYYDGGYTPRGNSFGEAGPVHNNEYVIPEKVLFSGDPQIPNIMKYLEAKREGKASSPSTSADVGDNPVAPASAPQPTDPMLLGVLMRTADILEKIEKEGVPAFLENDIKTAKKIREKQKELDKLKTDQKV